MRMREGVDAYEPVEGGEGAAANVAVGGLLERRRRLHGLLRWHKRLTGDQIDRSDDLSAKR
jgi:uncharacterized membrane protein (DUF4010 family)